jgi:hypothetical protein
MYFAVATPSVSGNCCVPVEQPEYVGKSRVTERRNTCRAYQDCEVSNIELDRLKVLQKIMEHRMTQAAAADGTIPSPRRRRIGFRQTR